jgi:tRNA (guanine-N7-)-methyltransferase
MAKSGTGKRAVRSFVRRAGRITPAQARALRELWPSFGVDFSPDLLNLDEVFGRSAEKILEIGFGDGEALVRDAALQPETDFLGVEIHEPGVGRCLMAARDLGLTNLRVIMHDAVEVLREQIEDVALSRVHLYFPDPWPKKRHHKRRLVQAAFLELAASKLESGGILHIATDWENYAEHIDDLVDRSPAFTLAERLVHDGDHPTPGRQTTKFERRGLKMGHRIWDWQLRKA